MNSSAKTTRTCGKAMLMATLLLASAPTLAAEYWLKAETLNLQMSDTTVVPMWGFAACDAAWTCSDPTVPGPTLDIPAGDTSGLIVHLRNTLPEPVSLVINGQATSASPAGTAPVWTDGTTGPRTSRTQRVRSFTHEASPSGDADYFWPTIKPGTYLYQSGTHPQVQVQMGLYGAMTSDGAISGSYAGSASYDRALTLLFSEIDPALHAAVGGGTYGTYDAENKPLGPTSTLDYNPKFFLINGKSFVPGDPPLATVLAGERLLFRFINAGLRTRVPVITSGQFRVIAEDGNLYPWGENPRQQYSILLPAAKTMDALYIAQAVAEQDARITIFDRSLGLVSSAGLDGGMMAYFDVKLPDTINPPVITTPAPGTVYYATQGSLFTQQIVVGSGTQQVAVLSAGSSERSSGRHDFSLEKMPEGMSVSENGKVSWVPGKQQVGRYEVKIRSTDLTGLYAETGFFVDVAGKPNTAPVGVGDFYTITAGGTLTVAAPGVLSNDIDADSDVLKVSRLHTLQTVGKLSTEADGSFTYTPASDAPGKDAFVYSAFDGKDWSAPTTVKINVIANSPPVTNNDNAKAHVRKPRRVYEPISIDVLANDSDPDSRVDATNGIVNSTISVASQPNRGGDAIVDAATGEIKYTPKVNFKGTEKFTYTVQDSYGATSKTANVTVKVE